ncbi:hypothetical protein ACRE_042320 [Hapsidospora chrysogenum ATCC 11550]|uniref:Uncharacterized protein n=1 Tax=Hapsidospora chrysogenum (strain ATCC 11550 / CBS 779.69 / DSM 880 / IAM 14645 / JCM 23072 / IMI 49137) TaxID=857340 RepID=A0A086T6K1_HAPC1|nr:hypothetical protein ACRE_042320 [Hapsidospora chrysogenum ATCC 11550]
MPPAQEDRDNRDGRDNRSHVHVNERPPFGRPGPARPTQGSAHPYRGGSRARLWASAWAKRSLKSVKTDEIPGNEKC